VIDVDALTKRVVATRPAQTRTGADLQAYREVGGARLERATSCL